MTWLVIIGVPILEIVVAAWVASWAGFWAMVLALVGLSALGIFLLPRVGLASISRVRIAVARGEDPSAQIVSRMLLVLGALLLILPGFVTGLVGLLLLLPPVRAFAGRQASRRIHGRVQVIRASYGGRVIDVDASDSVRGSRPELDAPP